MDHTVPVAKIKRISAKIKTIKQGHF